MPEEQVLQGCHVLHAGKGRKLPRATGSLSLQPYAQLHGRNCWKVIFRTTLAALQAINAPLADLKHHRAQVRSQESARAGIKPVQPHTTTSSISSPPAALARGTWGTANPLPYLGSDIPLLQWNPSFHSMPRPKGAAGCGGHLSAASHLSYAGCASPAWRSWLAGTNLPQHTASRDIAIKICGNKP